MRLSKSYNLRSEIYLVIPSGKDKRLVSSARLHESSPSIPLSLVMIWLVVCVRQVSSKENGLAFRVRHVMVQCLVRSISLSKITYKKKLISYRYDNTSLNIVLKRSVSYQ